LVFVLVKYKIEDGYGINGLQFEIPLTAALSLLTDRK
jgi:hypothetical protein